MCCVGMMVCKFVVYMFMQIWYFGHLNVLYCGVVWR